MLTISREAALKIQNHAFAVRSLEAFGYLLGTPDGQDLLVTLPCSKTAQSHVFTDRWHSVYENLNLARDVARDFGLDVIGFYCSIDDVYDSPDYQPPPFIHEIPVGLLIVYKIICCKSCSWMQVIDHKNHLSRWKDYNISAGKRTIPTLYQRRVNRAWIQRFGVIDFTRKETYIMTT
ncbi:MAG: hypothetical protein ABL868_06355 [Sulfuriferula sp.]